MMKRINLLLILIVQLWYAEAQVRTEHYLEKGWKFTREDNAGFSAVNCDDTSWQTVTIPHDWAIYGPFDRNNDLQKVAIVQDGQETEMAHAGRTGGLPFVGTGWYRLKFEVPEFTKDKKATLIFDGAMSHAQVYVNGNKVGYWPYGYNSFYLDVTPYLKEKVVNTLAVRLENKPESSRWYPGAGLYRNVHLRINNPVHIPVWGTQLVTPVVNKDFAKVNLKTRLDAGMPNSVGYRIITEIKDKDGRIIDHGEKLLEYGDENVFEQNFIVKSPLLWSPDTPDLYKAYSRIYSGQILLDEHVTTFGIRSLEFIPDKGFFLNGEKTYFKGVCIHHDSGPLGISVNDAAIRRQIRIMKEMGCNAIRTSHNMPAPELIKACDEMGMMVMAETFDEWMEAKCVNGYHQNFKEWSEKDMINLLHQFRNNPSIVMWCIGNEVTEQWSNAELGAKITRYLQDICHREDPTRPVTMGMDAPDVVVKNNMAAVLDIPGFNYRPHRYQINYAKLPQQIILGSETASTVSSRGVYKFPVVRQDMKKYDDHQASSYDVEFCAWSNLPEDDFIQHEDLSYCIGEFVWTGFDYLGEPTPYYTDWPSHSSLFGIVDLAGLPKDRYYLYRSHWNKEKETLHILPHWNWKGREGEVTPVFVYTNYPSAELFINGKSQGKRTKDMSVTLFNSEDSVSMREFKRQKRCRLMWMDTRYEPGTVKVVAYDKDGKAVAEKEIHTAGAPHHLELIPDRKIIEADGKDLSFVTVRIVDKEGNLCPGAGHLLNFKVKGTGTYRAGTNGDPACLDLFHLPQMHAFNGMMTAIVQSSDNAGKIVLEVTGKGLKKATLVIESR